MFKRSILLLLSIVVVAGLTTSCILDPKEQKDVPPPEPVVYKDLKQRDDVLYNLRLAYMERNMIEYDKLLDDNFIFIFSVTDYNNHDVDYPQWGREAEVGATTKMLNPNLAGDKRIISIDLTLEYPEDNWTELPANPDHPGESWWTKTVTYTLIVKTADDWEYRALNKNAQFTIRWAGTPEDGYNRIVLWRDDVLQQ